MSKIILRILLPLFFWGSFISVIFKIPYPETFTQANLNQILPFFIALFLSLIFTFNIFLKNILQSFSFSLGLIFLLILKALDALNFVTGILTLFAAGLLFSYFKKVKRGNRV